MPEQWASIEDLGYPDYSISDRGRIRNDKTERILRTSVNKQGVVKIGLVEYLSLIHI